MTATTLDPTVDDTAMHGIARVPLSRLFRAELRKITDTRAGRWLLIAIGAITAAATIIFFFAGSHHDLTFDNFVSIAVVPQSILLPVLGILAITSEWSQRTGLVTFTLEPSRARVVAAKVLAMIAVGLGTLAVAFALGAVGNLLGDVLRHGSGSWHYNAAWVGEIAVGQVLGILEGLAFGMLLMSSAAAIVLYFVIPIGWSILFNAVSALVSASWWVDLGTANQPLYDHTMTGEHWLQLAVASAIWVAVPLVVGAVRLHRSEVK